MVISGPATGSRRAVIALTALLAGTGLSAGAALLARLAWSVATGPALAQDPAAGLLAVTAAAAVLLAARLVLCSAACFVAVTVGGPPAAAGRGAARVAGVAVIARVAVSTSPRALRPALSALLAGSIAIGVAGPALAAAPPQAVAVDGSERAVAVPAAGQGLPSPGWSPLPVPGWRPTAPRRPPVLVQAAPAVHLVTGAGARSTAPDDEVVVRRGDSLWHLAARSLGPSATVAEIAAEWPRWWRANREVVGADPDLLVPGTRLRPPAP